MPTASTKRNRKKARDGWGAASRPEAPDGRRARRARASARRSSPSTSPSARGCTRAPRSCCWRSRSGLRARDEAAAPRRGRQRLLPDEPPAAGALRLRPENYHGPTLYYLTLPSSRSSGLNTFAIRLVPALFGVGRGVARALSCAVTSATVGGARRPAPLVAVSPGARLLLALLHPRDALRLLHAGPRRRRAALPRDGRGLRPAVRHGLGRADVRDEGDGLHLCRHARAGVADGRDVGARARRERDRAARAAESEGTASRSCGGRGRPARSCSARSCSSRSSGWPSTRRSSRTGRAPSGTRSGPSAVWQKTGMSEFHGKPWYTYVRWLLQEDVAVLVLGHVRRAGGALRAAG